MPEFRSQTKNNDMPITKRPRLSCIGAGRTGSTLCYLLAQVIDLNQIINQTMQSAREAVAFIGHGEAVATELTDYKVLKPSDIWMISCPDDQIQTIGEALFASGILNPGNIVFHCSGALSTTIWAESVTTEIGIASLHPIHSFSDPSTSVNCFSGVHCAVEGDILATESLKALFEPIGAVLFKINKYKKPLYHASNVMACNYLVSLLELSQLMLAKAVVDEDETKHLLQPLIRQTLNNYFNLGAEKALTGPISRGDTDTVRSHLKALERELPVWQEAYSSLGKSTLDIAKQQHTSSKKLDEIAWLLNQTAFEKDHAPKK